MSPGKQRVASEAPIYRKSDDLAVVLARAQAFHRFGQLAEAEVGYRKVLKKRPNNFAALHMLAVCEHQNGNFEAALRLLKRALLIDPQLAAAHSNLGAVLQAMQRHDEALASFDKSIALQSDFADAHYNRGSLLLELGSFDEAIISLDQALAISPNHANALNNQGQALHGLGNFTEAIASFTAALKLSPTHTEALVNRGCALVELRRVDEAIADFSLSLAIAPERAAAWANRGEALRFLGRLNEALADSDRALATNPMLPEAWIGRSSILMQMEKVTDALAACQRALAISPASAKALGQLGRCHSLLGDTEATIACFDRALAIKPDDGTVLSNRIFALDFSENGDFGLHQEARSQWWRRIGSKIAAEQPVHHENDRDPRRRIVLGYVSADFGHHSAAHSFRPVLLHHDKSKFEVICYSSSPTDDEVTASFRNAADRWRDVLQWSDERLAQCIRADKVDILIDLSGHTEGSRLRTFARKPAPIQVTAWGHATGTGLPTVDYILSDPVAIPAEVRHLYAERIQDLPCAIIIEPPPAGLHSSEPPVTSNGYLTYGVFNRVSKLSNAAIAVWARILQSDGRSRLLIKHQLIDDASIRSMLLEKFAFHGIAPDRISLMGSTSREQHLAAYRQVDICLDPFPHGGGVSTWETLYMGVPVVAKLGNGVTSRVGGAILSAIGMTDWVATDDDQYVAIALRSTPDSLRKIRHELPDLIDRRCGPAAYTREVEAAYRMMWEKWCAETR